MPHGIRGPTGFGGMQDVMRSGTTAANIRNLIDTRGFVEIPHQRAQLPAVQASTQWIPQNNPLIPNVAGGSWSDLIRDVIDRLWPGGGNGGGSLVPSGNGEPRRDIPGVPDFIDKWMSGTLPRGAVPYIELPDGTRGCPSGYHPEKSGEGYCVRNRRMNALNPRALSRASRRVGGFARAVKRARTLKRVCKSL